MKIAIDTESFYISDFDNASHISIMEKEPSKCCINVQKGKDLDDLIRALIIFRDNTKLISS